MAFTSLCALLVLMPMVTDAVCITSCNNISRTDGMRYPDCDDCNYYIRCEPSGLQRRLCPSSLVFNSAANNCDLVANSVCGTTSATTSATTTSPTTSATTTSPTTSATTTSPTTSQTTTSQTTTSLTTPAAGTCVSNCTGIPESSERYPHCTNCSLYVQCLSVGMVVLACPSGLHHNDNNDECDLPSSSGCTYTSPTTSTTTTTTTSATTSSTTSATTSHTTHPPSVCLSNCTNVAVSNERYPYCGSCTHYVECLNSGMNVVKCPNNLWHNDAIDDCDVPSTTTCYATASQTTSATTAGSTTGTCVNSCTGVNDGDYQHCTDCNKFVSCSNGIRYDMPCAAFLLWDDVLKECRGTSNTCTPISP
ncbi:probable endochitinase [Haliotis asinina]|uniref:probable endochitinase n=1 Tax=Haliotis asinina TaxID=109174 RepID=UPI003531E979